MSHTQKEEAGLQGLGEQEAIKVGMRAIEASLQSYQQRLVELEQEKALIQANIRHAQEALNYLQLVKPLPTLTAYVLNPPNSEAVPPLSLPSTTTSIPSSSQFEAIQVKVGSGNGGSGFTPQVTTPISSSPVPAQAAGRVEPASTSTSAENKLVSTTEAVSFVTSSHQQGEEVLPGFSQASSEADKIAIVTSSTAPSYPLPALPQPLTWEDNRPVVEWRLKARATDNIWRGLGSACGLGIGLNFNLWFSAGASALKPRRCTRQGCGKLIKVGEFGASLFPTKRKGTDLETFPNLHFCAAHLPLEVELRRGTGKPSKTKTTQINPTNPDATSAETEIEQNPEQEVGLGALESKVEVNANYLPKNATEESQPPELTEPGSAQVKVEKEFSEEKPMLAPVVPFPFPFPSLTTPADKPSTPPPTRSGSGVDQPRPSFAKERGKPASGYYHQPQEKGRGSRSQANWQGQRPARASQPPSPLPTQREQAQPDARSLNRKAHFDAWRLEGGEKWHPFPYTIGMGPVFSPDQRHQTGKKYLEIDLAAERRECPVCKQPIYYEDILIRKWIIKKGRNGQEERQQYQEVCYRHSELELEARERLSRQGVSVYHYYQHREEQGWSRPRSLH
jgi:hypothetical protein